MRDDIFYFTKSEVSPQDIVETAKELEYDAKIFKDYTVTNVVITYEENKVGWECYFESEDSNYIDVFEEISKQKILDFAPASVYLISFKRASWPKIKLFLKLLFTKYGGWTGSDTDDLEPIFDLSNIEIAPVSYSLP